MASVGQVLGGLDGDSVLLGANFESFLLVIFNPLMSFSVDFNQSFDELRMFFSKFSAYRENKVRLNQSLGCCDRLCAAFISLVNAAAANNAASAFPAIMAVIPLGMSMLIKFTSLGSIPLLVRAATSV